MGDLFNNPLYPAAVPVVARVHVSGCAHARAGHRRDDGHVHADPLVMLRSLPVSDPARLSRVGDGDNC